MNGRLMNKGLTQAICFIFLSVMGCASVPEGSPAIEKQALSFSPPAGRAGLYVTRPPRSGWGTLIAVSLDFRELGSLPNGYYIFTTVQPGKHALSLSPWSTQLVPFTAESGQNYFFAVKLGYLGGVPVLETLPQSEGMSSVRSFKLSGQSRAEYGPGNKGGP